MAANVSGEAVLPSPVNAMAAYTSEMSAIIPASTRSSAWEQRPDPGSAQRRRSGRPRKNTASSIKSAIGSRYVIFIDTLRRPARRESLQFYPRSTVCSSCTSARM